MNDLMSHLSPWWSQFVGYGSDWYDGAHQEQRLTSEKALSYAPIWYGVNRIAGHIAQLPVCVYKKTDDGAERDREHNIHKLMRRPNLYQTSIIFREQLAIHSLLDGNGRAAIVRSGNRVMELIPLLPECSVSGMMEGVKVHLSRPDPSDRLRLFFDPIPGDPGPQGLIMLDDAQVLHIPGLSYNGYDGIALRRIGQRNIGASINAETRLAKQMQQGFSGNLMLNAPAGVFRNQKDAEDFLDAFEKRHNSPDKAGKPGMLREGITANILATSNKDAEMIDNRRFQRQDAALYLGLESILGDDKSNNKSEEQKNLAYLTNTLNKWVKRWEEEIEYKLLPRRQFDNETHFVRFNVAALLKSDFQSSIEALSLAISSTIMSPNEARERLDMNKYPGGDIFRNPAPGGAPSTEQPEQPGQEDPIQPVSPGSLATTAHVAHLIGVESNRVKQASKKANDFIDWEARIDKFYFGWESTLADNFEAIGLDRDLATQHCAESRRQLEECDYSQPEMIAANVAKCVSNWKARANEVMCHV